TGRRSRCCPPRTAGWWWSVARRRRPCTPTGTPGPGRCRDRRRDRGPGAGADLEPGGGRPPGAGLPVHGQHFVCRPAPAVGAGATTAAGGLEPELTWNLVADVRQVLTYPFMVNAFRAGTIVAVLAGLVGWFMVLRRQSFAGHTLALVGFPGAAGAVLLGAS